MASKAEGNRHRLGDLWVEALETIARLRVALARYGNHLADCKAVDTFQHADCDCGFGVIEEEEGL